MIQFVTVTSAEPLTRKQPTADPATLGRRKVGTYVQEVGSLFRGSPPKKKETSFTFFKKKIQYEIMSPVFFTPVNS